MHVCTVCDREFDSAQKLGGHKGSHGRGEQYLLRRRGEGLASCATCGLKTRNPKFCSTACFYTSIRLSTVMIGDGTVLDITREELDEYRAEHRVCEICGQTERRLHQNGRVTQLCIDHDHDRGVFRGLLCSDCNRKLGWYEKYRQEANAYLKSKGN